MVYPDPATRLWSAECPTLRGCHSGGRTRGEAMSNIKEAVALYLQAYEETLKGAVLETIEIAR
ncbi:MAG: type II toxin-antitoxin system HicB family antitoxin [Planctomycetes bacterium]|nr:type II toxin-antitoxin system HicB family antitoxin [Planctomycetota bacterium]